MFIILGGDGKEYGPVPARKIHEWIHEGRADRETKAKRVGESEWKSVGEFVEFGGAPAAPPPPPLIASTPPPLEASVSRGPAAIAEPAPLATPPASLALRFLAALIDGSLKVLCYLPMTIPMLRLVAERSRAGEIVSFQESIQETTQVLSENLPRAMPFLFGLFCVQMMLITLRGQSIGKLLTRIRIVRTTDESSAGFARGFFLRSVVPYMIEQLPIIGFVFQFIDSCFIFREDRRCLHDLAADTKVIPARRPQG